MFAVCKELFQYPQTSDHQVNLFFAKRDRHRFCFLPVRLLLPGEVMQALYARLGSGKRPGRIFLNLPRSHRLLVALFKLSVEGRMLIDRQRGVGVFAVTRFQEAL
jgi:hypothetical protein